MLSLALHKTKLNTSRSSRGVEESVTPAPIPSKCVCVCVCQQFESGLVTYIYICTHERGSRRFFRILRDLIHIPTSLELDVFVIMVCIYVMIVQAAPSKN